MDRTTARGVAMQLLYEKMLGGSGGQDSFSGLLHIPQNDPETDYIAQIVDGALSHLSEIDALIEAHAVDWRVDRIARVDLAILRIAIFEMLYRDDIPDNVAIASAVELAQTFSTPESGRFINGVLGSAYRELKRDI